MSNDPATRQNSNRQLKGLPNVVRRSGLTAYRPLIRAGVFRCDETVVDRDAEDCRDDALGRRLRIRQSMSMAVAEILFEHEAAVAHDQDVLQVRVMPLAVNDCHHVLQGGGIDPPGARAPVSKRRD